jgi:hypothetical protein
MPPSAAKKRKTAAANEKSDEKKVLDPSYIALTPAELLALYEAHSARAQKLRAIGVLYWRKADVSDVWKHYRYYCENAKFRLVCLLCAATFEDHGTKNMRNHLLSIHKLKDFAPKAEQNQTNLLQYTKQFYASEREKALVYFLLKDMRPLITIHTDAFKDLCWELTKHDHEFTIPDPKTVSSRIRSEHNFLQAEVCFSPVLVLCSSVTHLFSH